jgi:hypothetical protein
VSATLNLQRFAEVSAEIQFGRPVAQVLEAHQIPADIWDRTQTFWLDKMAGEAEKGRLGLSNRYSELFVRHQAKLAREEKEKARQLDHRMRSVENVVAAIPDVEAPPLPMPGAGQVQAPAPVMPSAPAPVMPSAPAPVMPAAPYMARLTVQQFASLRAELVTTPEDQHEACRQRYGLDARTWSKEEAEWQRRMADKQVFQQYLQHFQYFRALMAPRV